MATSYDIFKNDPAGVVWVEAVGDASIIRERLQCLSLADPGEYFAYDVGKAEIIARSAPEEMETAHAYDLFEESEDGKGIWLETVVGLDNLQKRLLNMSSLKPGAYLVYDPTAGRFIEPFKKSA